jgi:DNA topoisomerase-1
MLDAAIQVSVEVSPSLPPPPPPGLRYVSDARPGVRRRRAGKGFVYFDAAATRITDAATLKRIRALVIPPAWTDVWICPSASGHIQATGRDAKGRKQYRYHSDYREAREEAKFEHMLRFAKALPVIRATVAEHMALRGLTRRKVLATVVHLLETTLIRVGNDEYAKANQSFGLTTLRADHVEVEGTEVRFRFAGKSGKHWSLSMRDRRVAKILRACQELPGQELLQYLDDDKTLRAVSSDDVNDYLREIAGYDVTAKNFRTWAGTVMMARHLHEAGEAASERQAKMALNAALKRVAAILGNTPAVCRKSYIHPAVTDAWLARSFRLEMAEAASEGLRPEEAALLAMLSALADAPAATKAKGKPAWKGGGTRSGALLTVSGLEQESNTRRMA